MKSVLPGLASAGRGAVHLAKAALKSGQVRKNGSNSSLVSSIRKRFNNNDKRKSGDLGNPSTSDNSIRGQAESSHNTHVNIPGLAPAYRSPYVEDEEDEDDEDDEHDEDEVHGRPRKKHHGEDEREKEHSMGKGDNKDRHLVSWTCSQLGGARLMFRLA